MNNIVDYIIRDSEAETSIDKLENYRIELGNMITLYGEYMSAIHVIHIGQEQSKIDKKIQDIKRIL